MEGLVAVIPNNEELETQTRDPIDGHGVQGWDVYGTDLSDVIACGTYWKAVGHATGLHSASLPKRMFYQVGRLMPSKIIGDDAIVLVGLSGIRLQIGAANTGVTGEWLLQGTPKADVSDDTTLITFYEHLAAFSPPNISIRTHVPQPSFEKFIERVDKPGYRWEPILKGKGIPVWAIAAYVLDLDLSYEEVVSDWGGEISVDEVKATKEYYQAHPEEIEQKRKWAPSR